MLFVDFCSAFNTDSCIMSNPFVTWIGRCNSSNRLNTGVPQGCVLRPLLFMLYTHDCNVRHKENSIVKYADDPTITGQTTSLSSMELILGNHQPVKVITHIHPNEESTEVRFLKLLLHQLKNSKSKGVVNFCRDAIEYIEYSSYKSQQCSSTLQAVDLC